MGVSPKSTFLGNSAKVAHSPIYSSRLGNGGTSLPK